MKARKIETLMNSKMLRVRNDESLATAYTLLINNWIRHLPVVDKNDDIIGIISERDFARARLPVANTTTPISPSVLFSSTATVGDFMSRDIYTISIDGNIREAINLMIQTKISSCLVEKEGEIVGIITTEDLLSLLKDYVGNPSGSLCSKIEGYIMTSPLGVIGHMLSNMGI